jgi:hypothetical protein
MMVADFTLSRNRALATDGRFVSFEHWLAETTVDGEKLTESLKEEVRQAARASGMPADW